MNESQEKERERNLMIESAIDCSSRCKVATAPLIDILSGFSYEQSILSGTKKVADE